MTAEIAQLAEKLRSRVERQGISLEYPSSDTLKVVPKAQDSFSIEAKVEDGKYIVSAANWHHHYEKIEKAFAVICWLLTPYYRIVWTKKEGETVAAWLEMYTDEGWDSSNQVYFVEPSPNEDLTANADELVILHQAVYLDTAFPTYYPRAELDAAKYPVGTILGETHYELRNDGWYPVGVPMAE